MQHTQQIKPVHAQSPSRLAMVANRAVWKSPTRLKKRRKRDQIPVRPARWGKKAVPGVSPRADPYTCPARGDFPHRSSRRRSRTTAGIRTGHPAEEKDATVVPGHRLPNPPPCRPSRRRVTARERGHTPTPRIYLELDRGGTVIEEGNLVRRYREVPKASSRGFTRSGIRRGARPGTHGG